MQNPKLYLIDGSYYLYRAYYAMPSLTTSTGIPTGAIYGVINMLKSLIHEEDPTKIAIIFDARTPSFRKNLYPEYKGNRSKMPDELSVQIQPLHAIIEALGIPLIVPAEVEADDLIAAYAIQASLSGNKVDISSGDKDLMQIVDDNITVVNSMTKMRFNRDTVKEKYGVLPEQIVDYLTLVGDSSDNIPGVVGIGAKTASSLLTQYQSIDGIYQNINALRPKIVQNMQASKEQIALVKKLVTLKTDLLDTKSWESLHLRPHDNDALRHLYQHYQLNTLLKEHEKKHGNASNIDSLPTTAKEERAQYLTITDITQLETVLQQIRDTGAVTIDTETSSLDSISAELIGIALSCSPKKSFYIPLQHKNPSIKQIAMERAISILKPVLEDPKIIKIGHNIKYDIHVLANAGIQLSGVIHDTMLQSYVLDSSENRHSLDYVAKRFFQVTPLTYAEVTKHDKKQIAFSEVPIETATPYAGEDVELTSKIYIQQAKILSETQELEKVYQAIERPLLLVLAKMEQRGVSLDTAILKKQSQECAESLHKIAEDAYQIAGSTFNLSSPKQIQTILYQQLKLPVLSKTPKGQPSTAEAVLQELANQHRLPQLLLEHRTLEKLKSTYTDALPKCINSKTGRVHTSFRQAVTSTGRLSSSDPNLQNIPIKNAYGRTVRKAFVAPKGYSIISADYSQIELRVMAHLSEDRGMIDAFHAKRDIHQHTASEVFALPIDQVTEQHRRTAKAINFGLIYGMSAYGLSRQLKIKPQMAQNYIDSYFTRYPKVLEYMETAKRLAKERGYTETICNRRLYIKDITNKNAKMRNHAERLAINACVQGSAADIIKLAMLKIDNMIIQLALPIYMTIQVHDELVFEVEDSVIDKFIPELQKAMTQVIRLRVPLEISLGVGANWDEAH